MMRWVVRSLFLVVLVCAGIWGYRHFFPSPATVIRKELNEIAELASFHGNESPLIQMSHSQKLSAYFTHDVTIAVDIPGRGRQTFAGRDNIMQAAMGARSMMGALGVELVGIQVEVAPDKQSATASFTARVSTPSDKYFMIQELKSVFQKVDRDWLVSRIETVKTLSDAPAQSQPK
jgi:hypothetical protein